MRRKVKEYIQRNKWWIISGIILTALFVKVAYEERGYAACGGEWLTLPLVMLLVEIARKTIDAIEFLLEADGE